MSLTYLLNFKYSTQKSKQCCREREVVIHDFIIRLLCFLINTVTCFFFQHCNIKLNITRGVTGTQAQFTALSVKMDKFWCWIGIKLYEVAFIFSTSWEIIPTPGILYTAIQQHNPIFLASYQVRHPLKDVNDCRLPELVVWQVDARELCTLGQVINVGCSLQLAVGHL